MAESAAARAIANGGGTGRPTTPGLSSPTSSAAPTASAAPAPAARPVAKPPVSSSPPPPVVPNAPPRSTASFRPQPAPSSPPRSAAAPTRPPVAPSTGSPSSPSSSSAASSSAPAPYSSASYSSQLDSPRSDSTSARQSTPSKSTSPAPPPPTRTPPTTGYAGSDGTSYSRSATTDYAGSGSSTSYDRSPSTDYAGSPSYPSAGADATSRPQSYSRQPTEVVDNYRPSEPQAPAAPSAAAPSPAADATPRVARLTIASLEPWSALKVSFLLSVAAGIALVVAVIVLWLVLNSIGVFDQLNKVLGELGMNTTKKTFDIYDYVGFSKVVSISVVIAVINATLLTALSTLAAFLYNLSAGLVGGVRVTLSDD